MIEATLEQILQELESINHAFSPASSRNVIEALLRRRGIPAVKYTDRAHLVLPEDCSQSVEDEFYHLMQKYSFRIFLRDLLQHADHLTLDKLTRYCSPEVAQAYLDTLVRWNILHQPAQSVYQFIAKITPNFGDTLEWFVAQVMEREFASPASWGNRLKMSESGGDYDVIAVVENHCVYIEVKSSPPKHIDQREIKGFFDRIEFLCPDLAIFLEDTHLRMKDKLAVIFAEEIQQRYGAEAGKVYPVSRLHDEIFTIHNALFISNAKPDIVNNIGLCLKQFLTKGIPRVLSFPPY